MTEHNYDELRNTLPEYLTVQELMQLMSRSYPTVTEYLRTYNVPKHTWRGRRVTHKEDVIRLLQQLDAVR